MSDIDSLESRISVNVVLEEFKLAEFASVITFSSAAKIGLIASSTLLLRLSRLNPEDESSSKIVTLTVSLPSKTLPSDPEATN